MNIDPKLKPMCLANAVMGLLCRPTVMSELLSRNIEASNKYILHGLNVQNISTDTAYTGIIPLGTEFGDSLYLYRYAFLPGGWSYTVSDTGWIHTPDSIYVTINHDSIVSCLDTARVIFYAYNGLDEFAGNAEVTYHLLWEKGDVNYNDAIDRYDIMFIDSLLYNPNWKYRDSIELGIADLNSDQRIDIADATRLVDYLYVSHELFACARDTGYVGPEISIATSYQNDTTTISLISPIDLKGLQLDLIALKNVTLENLLGDSIATIYGSMDSLYQIGLFDSSGGAVIKSGARNVLRIPGAITILSSRASDRDHHSLPLTTGRVITYEMQSGWNMISVPIVSDDMTNLHLFPSATSSAFTFENQYVDKDTLKHGVGYWLKFGVHEGHALPGWPISLDTISVQTGWNMIGSVADPIPVNSITSIQGGIVTSDFFGFTNQYITYDTIYPGKGYWVKVNQPGSLILSSSPLKNTQTKKITILSISELPPPPPDGMNSLPNIPKEYSLENAYPNPFNPTTTLKYALPSESRVKLTIYNVLGQVIDVLRDGVEIAGYRSAEWNASLVASGIYFYKLEATSVIDPNKSFTQVKKMLLVR